MTTTRPSPSVEGQYTTFDLTDDIDRMGDSNGELQDLTNGLVDRATAYRMGVNTEQSKLMTSSTINISADFSMNGQKLKEVTSFK